jgi:hypothetical protein
MLNDQLAVNHFKFVEMGNVVTPSKQIEILTCIVDAGPVNAVEIQPLLPPQSGEKQPDDPMRYFLDALLEFIVSQVSMYKKIMFFVVKLYKFIPLKQKLLKVSQYSFLHCLKILDMAVLCAFG